MFHGRIAGRLPKAVAWLLILSALVLSWAAPASAGSDDSKAAKSNASSFAPHPTGRRVYGAPIRHPIVHKRHKPASKTAAGSTQAAPPK